MAVRESTTVVIVGGGVAGLTAATLLRKSGVGCVILERKPRVYVEQRQRAGLVEYRALRMLRQHGLGEILGGFPADDVLEVRVEGDSRYLGNSADDLDGPGRTAGTAVPQQVLVRGLIAAFLADGGDLRFQAGGVSLRGLDTDRPVVSYTDGAGGSREIECAFVAGCDGDHGVSNTAIPDGSFDAYPFDYGISWLTVLADAPPPRHALMAVSRHGYAAHYSRGPEQSRFYLQCDPADTPGDWPEERIWEQLRLRLYRPELRGGPITETEVFPLRGLVREPMSYGRLYLLGDAAHIISPMGAKGMNLALYDAEVFAGAVAGFIRDGDETGLREYSGTCLARTWRYQEFAHWMAQTLHEMAGTETAGITTAGAGAGTGTGTDPFRTRLARARFDWIQNAPAGVRWYAEMMTGLG